MIDDNDRTALLAQVREILLDLRDQSQGLLIWKYPAGNAQALEALKCAAAEMANRAHVFVPNMPALEYVVSPLADALPRLARLLGMPEEELRSLNYVTCREMEDAVRAEREACASAAEAWKSNGSLASTFAIVAREIAQRIRERGKGELANA